MPRETLALLLDLNIPVQFIYGNGELAVLAQIGVTDPDAVSYWGTFAADYMLQPPSEAVMLEAFTHPSFR